MNDARSKPSRMRTTIPLVVVLTTSLIASQAPANTVEYAGSDGSCTLRVLSREVFSSPWPCQVQQAGSLTLAGCTATTCPIVATGTAEGSSAMPSEVRSNFSPTVRSMIAPDSDKAGKVICSATGTQTDSASIGCSGSTTYTVRRNGSVSLFCVFSEYALGPQFVIVTQRMWFQDGAYPSISEVVGSGC